MSPARIAGGVNAADDLVPIVTHSSRLVVRMRTVCSAARAVELRKFDRSTNGASSTSIRPRSTGVSSQKSPAAVPS